MLDHPLSTTGTDSGANGQRLLPAPESVANERFLADLRQFGTDLERLARQATSLTGDGAAVAREGLERAVMTARRSLGAARESAANRAYDARDRAERYIRHEPLNALAIAAAAGLVVALLLRRR